MRRLNLFLAVCLILPAASTVHAEVYTEAQTYWPSIIDSGPKPYSSVEYTSSHYLMSATAEAGNDWAKGISRADVITGDSEGTAWSKSISQFTTTFEVVSDGLVSFDCLLDGEMEIFLQNPASSTISAWTNYNLSVSDNISDDNVDLSGGLNEGSPGMYVTPVDITETYTFGGVVYSAGTLIDVTLELQTQAYTGFGVGSFIKSDFSNSLTIGNLVNMQAVPEPTSFILLLLGGIGLQRLRRR